MRAVKVPHSWTTKGPPRSPSASGPPQAAQRVVTAIAETPAIGPILMASSSFFSGQDEGAARPLTASLALPLAPAFARCDLGHHAGPPGEHRFPVEGVQLLTGGGRRLEVRQAVDQGMVSPRAPGQ